MLTFPRIHAAPLLALTVLGCVGALQAQQPAGVDGAVLKKAGTPNDSLPGSWLTYGKSQS